MSGCSSIVMSCASASFPKCLFRLQEFVDSLHGIPAEAKKALRQLTPATYVGNAAQQAAQLPRHL